MKIKFLCLSVLFGLFNFAGQGLAQSDNIPTWYDYDGVELRALDKITARSTTFKAKVGQTLKFGDIFIKVRSCRKPPSVEKEESASFIQVWEKDKANDESQWVFSGWMFASSPALSAMDHPIYDVWVLSCTGANPEPEPEPEPEIDLTAEAETEADIDQNTESSDGEQVNSDDEQSTINDGVSVEAQGETIETDTLQSDTDKLLEGLIDNQE